MKNRKQSSDQKDKNSKKKTDQEISREAKLKKLVELGVDVLSPDIRLTHTVISIVNDFSDLNGQELEKKNIKVGVPGRILTLRKMGRATFFHISDSRKKLQVYIREDNLGKKAYDLFSLVDIGDILAVEGVLFKTKTGELTVLADSFTFLAKCLHPLPEKWHGLQDVELRYRARYLDLIMNPDVGKIFRLRSAIISHVREFFDGRGYIEVETPMMHSIPGGALARPFKTFHQALGIDLFLRIAPELYLKKLVVGGMEKVYEINRNFRNEGISSEHNPEFTMLEFYEAYSDYEDMMKLTEELIGGLARDLLDSEELTYGEKKISLKCPWKRIRFKDALIEIGGLSSKRIEEKNEVISIASELSSSEIPVSYGKALDIIFDKTVKPQLVQPTFVTNPPKEISPLAKASRENPEEAERFELIIGGMEIANAFSELSDPIDQKERFKQQAEHRRKGEEDTHLFDQDYIQALEYGLPPSGGEGIGIDRLVMLFSNRQSIREVILFPLLRPKD